jgi:hypothetical protein
LCRVVSIALSLVLGATAHSAQPPGAVDATPAAASPPPSIADAAAHVSAALDRMDAWLGQGPNGDRWRQFLKASELRTELANAEEIDPAAVAGAIQRFSGDAKGLALGPFAAVRDALRSLHSSLRQSYRDDASKLALSARHDLSSAAVADLSPARADLHTRANALVERLGPDSALAAGWKKYLQWDRLKQHWQPEFQETRASLALLDQVLQRLRANQPGLEHPVFNNLATAIARYRALAGWRLAVGSSDPREVYDRIVVALGEELKRHHERPTTETTWKVSRTLGLVDSLGHSAEVVSAIRRQLVQPNIEATVSTSFIDHLPERRLDQLRPVRDCILGTSIFGTARTMGDVRYALLPADDSVRLAVHLTGEAHSSNRGYNGPVRINTQGYTTYAASSYITIRDDAFTASPAVATADTHTHIRSIQKTGGQFGAGLITKIAWRRAGEQKRQAERISSRHTEERVAREFNATVSRDLGALRDRYQSKVRLPLVRRGIAPEYLRLNSGPAGIGLETILATRSQLGADRPPPRPEPGSELVIQVHESAVNNYLVLALASARISQEAAENPPMLEGNVPNWIKVMSISRPKLAAAAATGAEIVEDVQETVEEVIEGQDDEQANPQAPPFKPYSITLNGEAPASVRFDDDKLVVRIRAARLASDDAEYFNWDFIVKYQIAAHDDRVELERVGDIEVFPTGFDPAWDKQLTAQQSGFRSTLAKNMNARAREGQSFPDHIPIERIRLTQYGTLLLQQIDAQGGWLTLGWALAPDGGRALDATAPPTVPLLAPAR